jgi:hypothetical protein
LFGEGTLINWILLLESNQHGMYKEVDDCVSVMRRMLKLSASWWLRNYGKNQRMWLRICFTAVWSRPGRLDSLAKKKQPV